MVTYETYSPATSSQDPMSQATPNKDTYSFHFHIVFAPFSATDMKLSLLDIPRDGEWHLMSNLLYHEGSSTQDSDTIIYFELSDLKFNTEQNKLTDNTQHLLEHIECIIDEIKIFLDKKINKAVLKDPNSSSPTGVVTVSLAAYSPFELFVNALCDIFGSPRINTKWATYKYTDFYNQVSTNLKNKLNKYTSNGWTFKIDYVGFLEATVVRRETVEEENHRKELIRQKQEAEAKAARAKAEAERLDRASMVITGVGLFLTVFTTVALAVACPPLGAAIAVSAVMGAGTVAASATLHVAQAKYEEEYLGETNVAKHVGLVLLDLALIFPWGSVGKAIKLGRAGQLGVFMYEGVKEEMMVAEVVDLMVTKNAILYNAINMGATASPHSYHPEHSASFYGPKENVTDYSPGEGNMQTKSYTSSH